MKKTSKHLTTASGTDANRLAFEPLLSNGPSDLLESSKEIFQKALKDFQPKAIVMMLSGGDDSTTTYAVARELGIKFDAVIHGNTRTGIKETTEFAARQVEQQGDNLIIADAGDAYEKYVLRKGFFGAGDKAHNFSYHVLKIDHFRKAVSHNLRRRRRNYPILFINGARQSESKRRKKTMVSPYRRDPSQKNNIWVNLINHWTKENCRQYLEGNSIERNPVAVNLCRSGECMCGTMQKMGDRLEAAYFYPKWGKWLDELEAEVLKKFPWRWGESISKQRILEMNGQLNAFENFQPMCTGCKINADWGLLPILGRVLVTLLQYEVG
jgi:3'-phosphoadenosine 5'-phosphosulfate sulfotransferase (PAPS reductase)/FAD synthetase